MQFANIQEACDYAVKKIVEQGGRCVSQLGGCAYGDGTGRHCAVGWLLPEGTSDEVLKHEGDVEDLIQCHGEALPDMILQNEEILLELQTFHDTDLSSVRDISMRHLRGIYGIDTSGEHWQRWVDMAKG